MMENSYEYHTKMMQRKEKLFWTKMVLLITLWSILSTVVDETKIKTTVLDWILFLLPKMVFGLAFYCWWKFLDDWQKYEFWIISNEKKWRYETAFAYLFIAWTFLELFQLIEYCLINLKV